MDNASTPLPPSPPPIIAAVAPSKKSKKGGKLTLFIIIGVVLLLVVVGIVTHGKKPAIIVQTEKVARRNITEVVVANGKIQPVTQVGISPEVAGEIVALPVKE